MPGGEVDNFLIPCFCRMLFKEKHPASSGRHYFFPHVGVGTSFFLFCVSQISFDYVVIYKLSVYAFYFLSFLKFPFYVQEAIMKYNTVPNEVLVRTSFLGAAKASKGRNLGCSDNRVCFSCEFFLSRFVFVT
jgi:hypothetical protein